MYKIFEELCKSKGVTPYRVCKETGLTTATVSNWKAGRYTPKQDKLQKIADYFGVSIEYLMTGEEKDNSNKPSAELNNVYFSLAKEAQDNNIDPRDIKMALEMLKKLKEGK